MDATVLVQLLDAVADGQAARVLALADEMAERGLAFSQALRELASLLHRIALLQGVPESLDEDPDVSEIRRLGQKISREQVQLYYQIALHGRNDLSLAPDEYAGFTMTLLRMLAFAPELAASATGAARSAALVAAKPLRTSVPPPVRIEKIAEERADPPTESIDWPALAARLQLAGLARELALRSELVTQEGDHFTLRVPVKALLEAGNESRVRAALSEHFGRPIRLTTRVGATTGPTAAGRNEQARAALQKEAENAIYSDPFVRELIENFGASVDPRSIRPAKPDG